MNKYFRSKTVFAKYAYIFFHQKPFSPKKFFFKKKKKKTLFFCGKILFNEFAIFILSKMIEIKAKKIFFSCKNDHFLVLDLY